MNLPENRGTVIMERYHQVHGEGRPHSTTLGTSPWSSGSHPDGSHISVHFFSVAVTWIHGWQRISRLAAWRDLAANAAEPHRFRAQHPQRKHPDGTRTAGESRSDTAAFRIHSPACRALRSAKQPCSGGFLVLSSFGASGTASELIGIAVQADRLRDLAHARIKSNSGT